MIRIGACIFEGAVRDIKCGLYRGGNVALTLESEGFVYKLTYNPMQDENIGKLDKFELVMNPMAPLIAIVRVAHLIYPADRTITEFDVEMRVWTLNHEVIEFIKSATEAEGVEPSTKAEDP